LLSVHDLHRIALPDTDFSTLLPTLESAL